MPRGSAPGVRRGGRQKGTRNKITHDVRILARDYGPAVIVKLAEMAGLTRRPGIANAAVRVAAMRELLDRGYGKATQIVAGDEERPVAIQFTWAPAQPEQPKDDLALPVPMAQPLTIDIEPEAALVVDPAGNVVLWKG
jgi:hypothetical protein